MAKHKPTVKEKFRTGPGTAIYAWLDKPDSSPKGKNKYKCGILLDKGVQANDALAKKLNDLHKSVKGKRDKAPVKDGDLMAEEDSEKYGHMRGKWLMTPKSREAVETVNSARVVCDHARSGDLVKLAIYAQDYDADGSTGVALYLNGVQLLERRNHGRSAADMFDDESDEFEADESEASASRAPASNGNDDSDDDGEGDDDGDY